MGALHSLDATSKVLNAQNSTVTNEDLKHSVKVTTFVNITTSSIFIVLLIIVVLAIVVLWTFHKTNFGSLNSRLSTLASLTGFGEQHVLPHNNNPGNSELLQVATK